MQSSSSQNQQKRLPSTISNPQFNQTLLNMMKSNQQALTGQLSGKPLQFSPQQQGFFTLSSPQSNSSTQNRTTPTSSSSPVQQSTSASESTDTEKDTSETSSEQPKKKRKRKEKESAKEEKEEKQKKRKRIFGTELKLM